MRVMVMAKATKDSEAGVMPSEELHEMTPELREKEERLRAELEGEQAQSR